MLRVQVAGDRLREAIMRRITGARCGEERDFMTSPVAEGFVHAERLRPGIVPQQDVG